MKINTLIFGTAILLLLLSAARCGGDEKDDIIETIIRPVSTNEEITSFFCRTPPFSCNEQIGLFFC